MRGNLIQLFLFWVKRASYDVVPICVPNAVEKMYLNKVFKCGFAVCILGSHWTFLENGAYVSVGLCPGLSVVTDVFYFFALCITPGQKIPKTLFFVIKTAKI